MQRLGVVRILFTIFSTVFLFTSNSVAVQAQTDSLLQRCQTINPKAVADDPAICAKCQSPLIDLSAPEKVTVLQICAKTALKEACSAAGAIAAGAVAGTGVIGPHGCCLTKVKEPNAEGKGAITKEECTTGSYSYADCYCNTNNQIQFFSWNMEYGQCQAACSGAGGAIDTSQGVGLLGPGSSAATASTASGAAATKEQFVNGLCFTPGECAKQGGTYTGQTPDCQLGDGKCIAPEPSIHLSSPILDHATVTGIRDYVQVVLRLMLNVALIATTIMFVYGGFKYIVSSAGIEIGKAKETIINALIGFFLTFAAVTILNTVNPATTSYSRLTVYMINKIQFSRANWCSDFAPKPPNDSKAYASAGETAAPIDFSAAKFIVDPPQTICGKKYYPYGYGGKTCTGRVCTDPGKACVSCKGGYGCVSAAMAGNISWETYHYPQKLILLAVCADASAGQTFDQLKDSVKEGMKAKLTKDDKEEEHGVAGFLIPSDQGALDEARSQCKNGLKGFVIGMQVKDQCTKLKSLLMQVGKDGTFATLGGAIGKSAGAFATAGAKGTGPDINAIAALPHSLLGDKAESKDKTSVLEGIGSVEGQQAGKQLDCLSDADDAIVLTKRDCSSGGGSLYSGYADGVNASSDLTDMKAAMYCGWHRAPGNASQYQANQDTGVFDEQAGDKNPYWTYEELKSVIDGKRQAFECDVSLTEENAPANPGTQLMFGCQGS